MNRSRFFLLVLFVALIFTASCAEINLAQENTELCARGISGFWWGLLHGMIAPFAFIGSLFNADISVYDICNNGGWYDFGFCLGIGAFSTGSHQAAKKGTRTEVTKIEMDISVETETPD